MRKAQDDAVARTVAENQVGAVLADNGHSVEGFVADVDAARDILAAFKAVEFETTTRKVGDEEIRLRRLVITGAWEVDPAGR